MYFNSVASAITNKLGSLGGALVADHVPLNSRRYGAKGIIAKDSWLSGRADCKAYPVVPLSKERARIPKEIYDASASFMKVDQFGSESSEVEVVTEGWAWMLPSGRVYTGKLSQFHVIARSGLVLAEASYKNRETPFAGERSEFGLDARFFPTPEHFSGRVANLILGGGSSTNIGHWVMDALPRLKLISSIYDLDSIDHVLVQGVPHSYRLESLTALGIDSNKVRFIGRRIIHVSADEFLVGGHPRGVSSIFLPKWAIDYLRGQLLPKTEELSSRRWPSKIYVSRKDSKLRGISNDEEVVSHLQQRGFEEIVLSEYGFLEKIALFANADEIVSMSGAGLVFLLFSRPGTKVVEIFPKGFVHYGNCEIAALSSLDYRYMISGDATGLGSWRAQRESVSIQVSKLSALLD